VLYILCFAYVSHQGGPTCRRCIHIHPQAVRSLLITLSAIVFQSVVLPFPARAPEWDPHEGHPAWDGMPGA